MTRSIAEISNRLSVFFLKKHGYLTQEQSSSYGGIKWTRGEWKNSINFWVCIDDYKTGKIENSHIELIYTNTNFQSGEKTAMQYKIPLVSTACNYGGTRYWFKCALTKNGTYCGRRVGVLYSVGKWFGCRYCADVAYNAQFESGYIRTGSISEPDVEQAYKEAKTQYYNGKPTRKYRRYLRLAQKMDRAWVKVAMKLGMKF